MANFENGKFFTAWFCGIFFKKKLHNNERCDAGGEARLVL